MRTQRRLDLDLEGTIIAFCATYELTAFAFGLPTISALLRRLPPPLRAAALAALATWMVRHVGPWGRRGLD